MKDSRQTIQWKLIPTPDNNYFALQLQTAAVVRGERMNCMLDCTFKDLQLTTQEENLKYSQQFGFVPMQSFAQIQQYIAQRSDVTAPANKRCFYIKHAKTN